MGDAYMDAMKSCPKCGATRWAGDPHVCPPKNAPNPKQAMGDKKIPLGLAPPPAMRAMCSALKYGAFMAPRADGQPPGYGPFNWRETKIEAMTYIHAALRHIQDWQEREENAPDSDVHHLGHAMASLAIALDAQYHNMLIDNRPPQSLSMTRAEERWDVLKEDHQKEKPLCPCGPVCYNQIYEVNYICKQAQQACDPKVDCPF